MNKLLVVSSTYADRHKTRQDNGVSCLRIRQAKQARELQLLGPVADAGVECSSNSESRRVIRIPVNMATTFRNPRHIYDPVSAQRIRSIYIFNPKVCQLRYFPQLGVSKNQTLKTPELDEVLRW